MRTWLEPGVRMHAAIIWSPAVIKQLIKIALLLTLASGTAVAQSEPEPDARSICTAAIDVGVSG
jgi:hypothetical protein